MGGAVRPRARLRRVQDAPEGIQGRPGEINDLQRPDKEEGRPCVRIWPFITEPVLVRPPDRELGGVREGVV